MNDVKLIRGLCAGCNKAIVGICLHGKNHWFHADGHMYRHPIFPWKDVIEYYDFDLMKEDRDMWMKRSFDFADQIIDLKREVESLKSKISIDDDRFPGYETDWSGGWGRE